MLRKAHRISRLQNPQLCRNRSKMPSADVNGLRAVVSFLIVPSRLFALESAQQRQ
jgi:hypothetical protein